MGDRRKHVLAKHGRLETERQREEPAWRDLAKLFRPDDADFDPMSESRSRSSVDDDVLDSTPQLALDSFVGGLFGQSVNPAARWFELDLDDEDLKRFQPVRNWLYRHTNKLYASCSPSVSDFYQRAPAWLANVGAFGWGTLYQEEDTKNQRIIDLALPIGQIYLDRDETGTLVGLHRAFPMKGEQIKRRWGEAGLPPNVRDDQTYKIVHAVSRNDDYLAGGRDRSRKPWYSCHVSPDINDWEVESGYYEFPYHVPTWNERANSAYATGPGHNVKADSQMLQAMERTTLTAAEFEADPVLLAQKESVVSVADNVPGNILYGAVNEAGKQLVQTLERKGDLRLTLQHSEQKRQAIRSGFYFSMMQVLLQRPQMTATEFLGFKEEDLRLMAPHLVRVQTGGLSPFIARRFAMLSRAGQIEPPPPDLAGKRISIRYVSPLARLLQVSKARGVLQFQQAIEQMAATDPGVRDFFDGDKAAAIVREGFTEVPDVLRDPRDVAQRRAAQAQMIQQQQQLEQAGQVTDMAATISHAQQAKTAATQRMRPN